MSWSGTSRCWCTWMMPCVCPRPAACSILWPTTSMRLAYDLPLCLTCTALHVHTMVGRQTRGLAQLCSSILRGEIWAKMW